MRPPPPFPRFPSSSSVYAFVIVFVASLLLSAPANAARFYDVATSAGVNLSEFTFGLAWSDFDGDGKRDLLSCRHFSPPVIYRELSNGTFDYSFDPPLFEPADHHGPVVADFDNDGDPDIYLTGGAEGGSGSIPKHFYRNDGAFQFVNIAEAAGLSDPFGRGRSCSAMDVNNDGWIDLFVAKAKRPGSPNSLFLNDGAGNFTDIAASAGIADEFGSVGGVWGDYDHDGDADLFVSGEEDTLSQSRLYRNNGNLTFTNVTNTMLPGLGRVAAAAWGDFDKDGDLDLAVGLGDEALFDGAYWNSDKLTFFFNAREDENGVDGIDFTTTSPVVFDLYYAGEYLPQMIYIGANGTHPGDNSPIAITSAQAAGQPVYTIGQSVGMYIWTVGNSWKVRCCAPPDVGHNFGGIINGNASMSAISTNQLEPYTHGPRGTRLYRNDGSVFTNVTSAFQINDGVNVRNLTWVDYDRDGDLDLHVLAKGDTQSQNEPDLLYRNRTDFFSDEASQQHLQGPTNGIADACAWEDYDGDGDLDMAAVSGAPPRVYSLLETDHLYQNDSTPKKQLRVKLVGTASQRDGMGAWVTCISSGTGTQKHYVTGNAWRGGQVMTVAYFGLNNDSQVQLLRVEWPTGLVNEFTNVPAGTVTVTESGAALEVSNIPGAPGKLQMSVRQTPARGSATLDIKGALGSQSTLEIFDTSGRRVCEQRFDKTPAWFDWSGKDRNGRRVGNGVYYAALREGNRQAGAKIVMLR